jgi:hypothetical protein
VKQMAETPLYSVQWDTGYAEFGALDELDTCLDNLESQHGTRPPMIVIVSGPGTISAYFGIGGGLSFLSSCNEPYETTVGDATAKGARDYFFEGHHSQVENRHLIPRDFSRKVLREFCTTGTMPTWQAWEPLGA